MQFIYKVFFIRITYLRCSLRPFGLRHETFDCYLAKVALLL